LKLITVPASPYGRKVRAMLHEIGKTGTVEIVHDNPWTADTAVPTANPVGKVPVLVLDDGTALYDSAVICEYLDHLAGGSGLYPAPGPARWAALRQQRLADQLMDAFVLRRLEGNRPEERRHAPWIERQWGVVQRCLDAAEAEAPDLDPDRPTIGQLALAASLAHLDFRRGSDPDWREGRPALTAWYDRFAERPSMRATPPHD
jgi:glutathione S-transferase